MKEHDELEQLLKAASGPKDTSKKTRLPYAYTQVREFIAAYSLTEGGMPVAKELIYDYYLQWSKNPVSKKSFFTQFNIFIPTNFFEGNRVHYVDPSKFNLPEFYSISRDPRFFSRSKKQIQYTGVFEIAGYYIARLRTEENNHYLGRFKTAKEAARVYDEHALKHFGSDAKLNFPGVGKHEQSKKESIRKTTVSGSKQ